MARNLVLTDPRHVPREHGRLARLALKYIKDERDLPFAWLSLGIVGVLLPFAALLYWPGVFTWWLGGAYLAVNFTLFFDRFILMLHNTSHRPLFKRAYRRWNKAVPWVFGPLFGQTPETYFTHHIGMHHAEENLANDLSTTMPFRRDSFRDFLIYWSRFFFAGIFDLAAYHYRRGRTKLFRMTLIGELSWYAAVVALMLINWQATLTVFVVPFVAARFLMMAGNWSQHAFIDPVDPANPYKSSIVCINCRYNERCFNDGYHIGHHEKATRHWTEMPADFEAKRARYVAEDAVVFEGTDYFAIWLWLMLKRYDKLADHFLELRDEPRSRQEIIAMLKERVQPTPHAALESATA